MRKVAFIAVKCATMFGLKLAVCQGLKGQQSLSQPDSPNENTSALKQLSHKQRQDQIILSVSDNQLMLGLENHMAQTLKTLYRMVVSFKIKL